MITYRKARSEDILPAITLWCRIWDEFVIVQASATEHDYDEIARNSGLLKKYENGERIMLVAADDEKIVGVIGAEIGACSIKPPLCVDRRYQRQGIAAELLYRMVCVLKIAGCSSVRVDSSEYALPFYAKAGFVQVGTKQQHEGFVSVPMEYVVK